MIYELSNLFVALNRECLNQLTGNGLYEAKQGDGNGRVFLVYKHKFTGMSHQVEEVFVVY